MPVKVFRSAEFAGKSQPNQSRHFHAEVGDWQLSYVWLAVSAECEEEKFYVARNIALEIVVLNEYLFADNKIPSFSYIDLFSLSEVISLSWDIFHGLPSILHTFL